MAYIYLDELKEILPEILDQWVDEDDESWDWIFQEIEQKCHVGKRKKDKKWKKRIEDDIYQLKDIAVAHRNHIDRLTKRVDELSNKISNLSDLRCKYDTVASRVDRMDNDIRAAKLMAQTAKDRTHVDYSKYSGKSDGNINYNKEKSDADVIQEVYNRMAGRGATFEELNTFRNLIQKYDALEKKEIPVVEKACETCKDEPILEEIKCSTCKYEKKSSQEQPCRNCCHNTMDEHGTDRWEAKDNG